VKVLVADDDPQLVRALRITLSAHGYEVIAAPDGAAAIALAGAERPDIVMLDLGMPQLDGVAVIEALRRWTSIPIIVVSGRAGSADKVEALDAGADDFVTKPFQIDELLARLRALSRRAPASSDQPVVSFGDVRVDLAAKAVTRAGVLVHLTPTEWQILEMLARKPGALVTRTALLEDIWGTAEVTDTGYLRLYLSQLRKKLEEEPAHPVHLLTEAGMGYRLVLDGPRRAEAHPPNP